MKTPLLIMHWAPRILAIIAILFVSVFALDSFDPELTLWQQISGFIIHLLPTFVLTIFLIVAWKWEWIGGVMFTVLGLGLSPIVYSMNYMHTESVSRGLAAIGLITLPFVLVGVLFILSHFLKKKQENHAAV